MDGLILWNGGNKTMDYRIIDYGAVVDGTTNNRADDSGAGCLYRWQEADVSLSRPVSFKWNDRIESNADTVS